MLPYILSILILYSDKACELFLTSKSAQLIRQNSNSIIHKQIRTAFKYFTYRRILKHVQCNFDCYSFQHQFKDKSYCKTYFNYESTSLLSKIPPERSGIIQCIATKYKISLVFAKTKRIVLNLFQHTKRFKRKQMIGRYNNAI